MNIELNGSEQINTSPANLWESVIDPAVLQRAIPGCINMTETGEGQYQMTLELKVAAVGGSFEGAVSLSEMNPPNSCIITVLGSGTLGTGGGNATVAITDPRIAGTITLFIVRKGLAPELRAASVSVLSGIALKPMSSDL